MALILEGVDCSGKSTYARILKEEFNFDVVQGSSFEIASKGTDYMFNYMHSLLVNGSKNNGSDNLVIDRHVYSNIVYSTLFGYPMMKKEQIDTLVSEINKNSIVAYLHANPIDISNRMYKRGDDMVKPSDVDRIMKRYSNVLLDNFHSPSHLLSICTDDFNDTDKNIDMIINLHDSKIDSIR